MLPDSMNVGVIAENIKKLEAMVQEAGSKLPTPEAGDVGKIIKVGSDGYELAEEYSYTPPAYSTTETNTGRKWIDGKDIYFITFEGTIPAIETTTNITLAENFNADKIIEREEMVSSATGGQSIDRHFAGYSNQTKILTLNSVTTAFANGSYYVTVYYTKPTPTPETETKRKTSKKGE